MSDDDRIPSEEALQRIVEQAQDGQETPFEIAALWARLCALIQVCSPDCTTDPARRRWLEKNVAEAAGRTYRRWNQGKNQPTWGKLREVRQALNKKRLTAELTEMDMVRGLPLSEPASPAPAGPSRGAQPLPRPAGKTEMAAGQRDLAALQAEVEAILRKESALARALAGPGHQHEDASDIAHTVMLRWLDTPANEVAEALAKLTGTSEHRRAARHLFWHMLPLAGDWEDVLEQAQAAGPKAGILELKYRTTTYAEIAMARLEARCCLFAPGGAYPQGVAHVPLPAVVYTPTFDTQGERLADAVLMNLWREHSLEERLPDEETWRRIKKECADEREFMALAAAEINTRTLQEVRRYLLFIDALLPCGRDIEQAWTVARGAIAKVLPGLRVVRLKGRHEQMAQESSLRTLVARVRDLS